MATAMTMTLPSAATTTTISTTLPINEPCCPNCGLSLPPPASDPHTALLQAQRQIEDLQAQVRLLNQKATAAADRWADYEDELSRLRAASTSTNSTTTTSTRTNHNNTSSSSSSSNNNNNRPHTPDPSVSNSSPRSSFLGAGAASRISQLLSPRKSAAAAAAAAASSSSTPPPPTVLKSNIVTTPQQQQRGSLSSVSSPALPLGARDHATSDAIEARELMTALAHERRLRAAAEEKLAITNREVEDLSASLFEQANDMVATERRARAALEERVRELQQRDQEKRARISRLEGAVKRIERVRDMLGDRDDEEEGEGGEETERKEGENEEKENEKEERDEDDRKRESNKSVEGTGGNANEGDR